MYALLYNSLSDNHCDIGWVYTLKISVFKSYSKKFLNFPLTIIKGGCIANSLYLRICLFNYYIHLFVIYFAMLAFILSRYNQYVPLVKSTLTSFSCRMDSRLVLSISRRVVWKSLSILVYDPVVSLR